MEQVGLELLAKNAGQYIADIARSERATQQFTGGLAKTKDFDAFEQIAIGAFRRVGEAAVDLAARAGQQVAGFVHDSVRVAGTFESGMNEFAAVAGGALDESGVSLEQFRDQFITIGKELPVSTSEVQQAAIELVKGGIDPATIAAGGLRQSIQFAAAAGLNLEQAATIAAKAVGGWASPFASAQEKADFLTHSTDLLARAANASTVNVDDLALGLYNVQGTAKLAGASFDETVTALAQLAPSFSSSADAGTSLKTFLARLQPATKPATEAMESLGLWTDAAGSAFYNAKGEFVGMEQASQLLYEATKGLTEAQREQALQAVFGQDAIRAAAVFAEQGAAGYDMMTESLAKQNGVAELAAQKQQGFDSALKNAQGSIEALQITIGTYLLPVLTELLNTYIAPAINAVTDFAKSLFEASDPVTALSGTLDSFLPGLGEVVRWLGTAIPQATTFLTSLWQNTLAPAIAELADFFQVDLLPILRDVWAIAFPALQEALRVVAATWTNVLQPALAVVWKYLREDIMPALKEVTGWLATVLPPVIRTVADILTNYLLPGFRSVIIFIDQYVLPVFRALAALLDLTLGTAVRGMALLWENILEPAIRSVAAVISTSIGPAFNWLKTTILDPVGGAIENLSRRFNDLFGWIGQVGSGLMNLRLPSWLTPGSPTPLELGLDGINGAMRQLATTTLPAFKVGMERVTPVASAQTIVSTNTQNTTYNRTYNMPVYTTQSPAVVQQSMQIAEALAL